MGDAGVTVEHGLDHLLVGPPGAVPMLKVETYDDSQRIYHAAKNVINLANGLLKRVRRGKPDVKLDLDNGGIVEYSSAFMESADYKGPTVKVRVVTPLSTGKEECILYSMMNRGVIRVTRRVLDQGKTYESMSNVYSDEPTYSATSLQTQPSRVIAPDYIRQQITNALQVYARSTNASSIENLF